LVRREANDFPVSDPGDAAPLNHGTRHLGCPVLHRGHIKYGVNRVAFEETESAGERMVVYVWVQPSPEVHVDENTPSVEYSDPWLAEAASGLSR